MNDRFWQQQSKAFLVAALVPMSLALSMACAGCRTDAQADGTPRKSEVAEPAAVTLDTAAAVETPMPDFLLVTGTLLANQESKVAAGVAGKVLSTRVERGSTVKKGDVLAVLDTRTVAANVAEAQASARTARTNRELAQQDCDRSKTLHASGAMSQAEFDKTQAQCQSTQSQAEAAEARARSLSATFSDADIRAPFSGSVAERNVSAGEYVQAATVVATVVEIEQLRLELSVPESAVLAMHEGQTVEFRLAADEGHRFSAIVRYVGSSVRRSSRDLLVEAVVDNKDKQLVPGMFATARVHTGDPKRVVVPAAAVREEGSLHHVFVVRDGKAEDRIVQLGEKKDDVVAVLDGVRAGEQVALSPAQLSDGQRVQARPAVAEEK